MAGGSLQHLLGHVCRKRAVKTDSQENMLPTTSCGLLGSMLRINTGQRKRGCPLKGKYCRLCKITSTHLIPPQSRQVLKLFILLCAYWKTGDTCFQKLDAVDTYLNNSTNGTLTPLMPAVLIVFHRIILLKNGSKILVWNLVSFWAQHFPPKPAL